MRTVKLFFLLSIFLLSFQYLPSKPLSLYLDFASFRGSGSKVMLEVYYSFPDTMLNYIYTNNKFTGELYFYVRIRSSARTESEKEWIVTYNKDNNRKSLPLDLFGVKNFEVLPGQYTVDVNIKDVNDSASHKEASFNMIVKKINENSLAISDMQLAQLIVPSESTTISYNQAFLKNGFYVIPNPMMMYVGNNPVLSLYTEIYNAAKWSPSGFNIEYKIFDAVKREVITFPKEGISVGDGLVETVQLPINVLPTGVYFAQILVSYPKDSPTDTLSSIKKFYIMNPEIPPALTLGFTESASYEKSEFATLTDEQAEKEYLKAKAIATPDEIDLFEELSTGDAKRKFLFRFWQNRDNDTTTAFNERLNEYRRLIKYADTYFTYGQMREGWRSNRGRVLLQYGQPTQRDQVMAKDDYRAYETWFYNNYQGGVTFYFVDLNGFGDFTLVHSTMYGEIRNENWYKQYVQAHNTDAWKDELNNSNSNSTPTPR
ncbi:MAG: GWxTD domain-containing protein [Bacteroidota bacterium]